MLFRTMLIAGIAVAAAIASPARATVTYSVTFDGATLRDYTNGDAEIGTFGGSFSLTIAGYITSLANLATDSCSLSANATALYACGPTQTFDPNAFLPASAFIGVNTVNTDASGSGTGYLFFDPGSLGADGIYTLDITPPDGYGSFAATATLTVRSTSVDIPEPASLALLAGGLLGLGAIRRRGQPRR